VRRETGESGFRAPRRVDWSHKFPPFSPRISKKKGATRQNRGVGMQHGSYLRGCAPFRVDLQWSLRLPGAERAQGGVVAHFPGKRSPLALCCVLTTNLPPPSNWPLRPLLNELAPVYSCPFTAASPFLRVMTVMRMLTRRFLVVYVCFL
jgi:hypothetical protein